jgi:acyl-CoA reductase-like NAD-dependent aldehyde dehydrogenase
MLLSSLEKYDFQLTIDGIPYSVPRAFDVINPATEAVIASSPDADERAVDAAVYAARRAAPAWAKLSVEQRADVVRKYAEHVEDNADALSELLVLEQRPAQRRTLQHLQWWTALQIPQQHLSPSA